MLSAQCLRHTAELVKDGKYKSARQFVDLYLLRTAARDTDRDINSPTVAPES